MNYRRCKRPWLFRDIELYERTRATATRERESERLSAVIVD